MTKLETTASPFRGPDEQKQLYSRQQAQDRSRRPGSDKYHPSHRRTRVTSGAAFFSRREPRAVLRAVALGVLALAAFSTFFVRHPEM
jgi:hypothetical protein